MLKVQVYGGAMQIGSATSFLNSVGQAFAATGGVNGVKLDNSSKHAQSDTEASADNPGKTNSAQLPAAGTNARRGSFVNIVV